MPPHEPAGRILPRGFTLVETLVTVSILVLLGALLFPTLKNMTHQARTAKCAGQLRQIAVAGLNWASDNSGRLPDRSRWFSRSKADPYSLFPYLGFPDTGQQVLWDTVFTCPAFQRDFPTRSSPYRTYSINRYAVGSNVDDAVEWQKILNTEPPETLARVKSPSRMAFFMDGRPGNPAANGAYSYRAYAAPDSIGPDSTPHLHEDGLNVVFLDGHLERVTSAWIVQEQLTATANRVHPFWGAGK